MAVFTFIYKRTAVWGSVWDENHITLGFLAVLSRLWVHQIKIIKWRVFSKAEFGKKNEKFAIFSLILHKKFFRLFWLIFWWQNISPDEIPFHLIGRTIWFSKKIRISCLKPRSQKLQRWPKAWKLYFFWKPYSATYQMKGNYFRINILLSKYQSRHPEKIFCFETINVDKSGFSLCGYAKLGCFDLLFQSST